MKITGATIDGNALRLELDPASRREAGQFVYKFKSGDYELKRRGKKRSLNANALAWRLIDQIAQETGMKKEEVYRNSLREIPGISDIVSIPSEAFPRLKSGWERQGLGWQCIEEPAEPGRSNAVLIYGSSVFDTKQMSMLIDSLIQDAQALGIETLSERELSLLEDLHNGKE